MSDLVGNPEDRFSRVTAHSVSFQAFPCRIRLKEFIPLSVTSSKPFVRVCFFFFTELSNRNINDIYIYAFAKAKGADRLFSVAAQLIVRLGHNNPFMLSISCFQISDLHLQIFEMYVREYENLNANVDQIRRCNFI